MVAAVAAAGCSSSPSSEGGEAPEAASEPTATDIASPELAAPDTGRPVVSVGPAGADTDPVATPGSGSESVAGSEPGSASGSEPGSASGSEPTSGRAPPEPDRALPTSGPALAAALAEAEAAIRNPAVGDEAAAAWGRHQQRLYRHLADHPDWAEAALAIDDPLLRRAAEANWRARVALDALVASHGPNPDLPAWRVVEPRSAAELLGYYRDGEARWGIDWPYLAAINLIETRMGRIEGLSSAGAVGPMQFLPTTWAGCCEGDPTDPADAIPGAARYLTIRGGPEDMERAIWGYNNSDHYVEAVTAYASVMAEDELAYRGYHAWEIHFRSTEGLIHIPVGYERTEPIPAADWLAEHPEALVGG